jgi:hypothetical protein
MYMQIFVNSKPDLNIALLKLDVNKALLIV